MKAEAARANVIKDFLIGVLGANDTRIASDKPRGQITARELLDVSAEKIEKEFAAYPATQHELLGYFSEIYANLGEEKLADALLERQRLLVAKHFTPLSDQAVDWTMRRTQRVCNFTAAVQCAAMLDTADALLTRAGKDESRQRADWWRYKAGQLQQLPNAWAQREAALLRSVALLEKHEPNSRRLVSAHGDIGVAYNDELNYPKAIEHYQRALAIGREMATPNASEVATLYSNLGMAYSASSQFDQAIATFRTASDYIVKTVGPTDALSWAVQQQLAVTYARAGQREASFNVFRELMPHLPPATTPHPEADRARNAYADALVQEGRAAEAIPILEEIERHYLANAQYEFLLRSLRWSLGWAYQAAGRFAEAQRALNAALDEGIEREKPEAQMVLALREAYGSLLLEMRDLDGAQAQFAEIVSRANGRNLSHVALAYGGLARVAAARKQADVALAHSAQALEIWANKTGFSKASMEPRLHRMRADALAAAGRVEEAQKFEDDAWRASQRIDGPGNASTRRRVMKTTAVGVDQNVVSRPPTKEADTDCMVGGFAAGKQIGHCFR